uniref:Uncharacterized protein n=1 Tax=Parascaris univalens TaxID=6257 RepID=A0A915C7G3_PARUN
MPCPGELNAFLVAGFVFTIRRINQCHIAKFAYITSVYIQLQMILCSCLR